MSDRTKTSNRPVGLPAITRSSGNPKGWDWWHPKGISQLYTEWLPLLHCPVYGAQKRPLHTHTHSVTISGSFIPKPEGRILIAVAMSVTMDPSVALSSATLRVWDINRGPFCESLSTKSYSPDGRGRHWANKYLLCVNQFPSTKPWVQPVLLCHPTVRSPWQACDLGLLSPLWVGWYKKVLYTNDQAGRPRRAAQPWWALFTVVQACPLWPELLPSVVGTDQTLLILGECVEGFLRNNTHLLVEESVCFWLERRSHHCLWQKTWLSFPQMHRWESCTLHSGFIPAPPCLCHALGEGQGQGKWRTLTAVPWSPSHCPWMCCLKKQMMILSCTFPCLTPRPVPHPFGFVRMLRGPWSPCLFMSGE